METNNQPLEGLSPEEVMQSRKAHGSNSLYVQPSRVWWHMLRDMLTEPMVLLLLLACGLYFFLGEPVEGWFMAGAIVFVVLIEVVQDYRSEKALKTLKDLSQPRVTVIRSGARQTIPVEEVVVGELIAFSEGERIAADAVVVQQNDLSVDEALLTGESLPVFKKKGEQVYQGSAVSSGAGVGIVGKVGAQTQLGQLGLSLETVETTPTPLQLKISRFVRQMMIGGLVAFLVVILINIAYGYAFGDALLYALAMAMALIPEEIPVAFTTFMALGAHRLIRREVLVKQPRTVESLGAATVICLDKTGTITENRMKVADVVDYSGNERVLEYARWASEPIPFDAMEIAICEAWEAQTPEADRPGWTMVHEYPLGGVPPMMTHVYNSEVVAAKGAVERMLRVCGADEQLRHRVLERTKEMARMGRRVLGVASASWNSRQPYPKEQDDFDWQFEGLVALHDPPKANIRQVMEGFYHAGLEVKMVTGDFPETAKMIANESGIHSKGQIVLGEQVMQWTDDELQEQATSNSIFARMFPEAKLRLVEALKSTGEVVAMTGDGVNDGPALKSAQVGVAMGLRGTETARAAASMVLLDDDLGHMVDAVRSGRRIYNNLRKAIRYILSIHLPIVLVVALPLMLAWPYLHIFTPLHVIFLELIMGPTCAIAFENEPGEPGGDRYPSSHRGHHLFTVNELLLSMIQGLAITLGLLLVYQLGILNGEGEWSVRSRVFLTLISANIFLTLTNRSFRYTLAKTLFYKNNIIWWIIGGSVALTGLIFGLAPVREVFRLDLISWEVIGVSVLVGFVSVIWFEGWKAIKSI